MKKLNKLQINSEKIIDSEELLALRGGYGSYQCYRTAATFGGCSDFIAYINTSSCWAAFIICKDVYG